jgi:hypothetical protein
MRKNRQRIPAEITALIMEAPLHGSQENKIAFLITAEDEDVALTSSVKHVIVRITF